MPLALLVQRRDLPVIVTFLVVAMLLIPDHVIVFCEEPLGFIMDEIAENFKGIPLLDGLLFEQLGDDGNPRPNFFELLVFFFDLLSIVSDLRFDLGIMFFDVGPLLEHVDLLLKIDKFGRLTSLEFILETHNLVHLVFG